MQHLQKQKPKQKQQHKQKALVKDVEVAGRQAGSSTIVRLSVGGFITKTKKQKKTVSHSLLYSFSNYL